MHHLRPHSASLSGRGTVLSVLALLACASGLAAQADASCSGGSPEMASRTAWPGLSQPPEAPEELLALVEIPAGGQVKYEIHASSGRIEADRFLSMPVAYPVNYGVLPCTLAEDDDAVDVLILTRAPLLPGSVIRVRVIGMLRMIDRGDTDHKVLVVPARAVDPTYDRINTHTDLPPEELGRIEAFFRVYKLLPEPAAEVRVGPWEDREAALAVVRSALDAYQSYR